MGKGGIQAFVNRNIRGFGRGRAARGEILGSISSVVLGITAGEAGTVLAFSCERFEMAVLVLAGVVGLASIPLCVLFLSSAEWLSQRL